VAMLINQSQLHEFDHNGKRELRASGSIENGNLIVAYKNTYDMFWLKFTLQLVAAVAGCIHLVLNLRI
jgi:hypothetical protein